MSSFREAKYASNASVASEPPAVLASSGSSVSPAVPASSWMTSHWATSWTRPGRG
ncbi:hypothetical protein NKH77_24370 [Streptomyces sp. M19]